MATKKEPRRATASGSVEVKRSLEHNGRVIAADGGSELFPVEEIEGPVAEVTGLVGLTIPTDEEYKVLRIECGGRRPCSVADFDSGKAHRHVHRILRREFAEQARRGTKGLED